MIQLSVIWGIFAIVFFTLGLFQWKMGGKSISHFQVSERPLNRLGGAKTSSVEIAGADIDEPLKDFVSEFNQYIDNYNQTSKEQNGIQAIGYGVASLTAVFSLILARLC